MDGLKQRIIGALVLISLAVIFVPMIFDEPHSERQSTPITIPEEPPFPEVDMPAQPDARNFEEPETDDSSVGYRMVEEPAEADAAHSGSLRGGDRDGRRAVQARASTTTTLAKPEPSKAEARRGMQSRGNQKETTD